MQYKMNFAEPDFKTKQSFISRYTYDNHRKEKTGFIWTADFAQEGN